MAVPFVKRQGGRTAAGGGGAAATTQLRLRAAAGVASAYGACTPRTPRTQRAPENAVYTPFDPALSEGVTFTVPGTPVPKKRPRVMKRGKKVITYTPQETVDYETKIARHARETYGDRPPLEGALQMHIEATFALPKRARGRQYHLTNPDVDNLAKTVMDALEGILYLNDNQIIGLSATKSYGEEAQVKIVLQCVKPTQLPAEGVLALSILSPQA